MYHTLYEYAQRHIDLAENSSTPVISIFYCATVSKIGQTIDHADFKAWSHRFLLTFLDNEILPNGCLRECVLYDSLEWQTLILSIIYHCFSYNSFNYFHHKTKFGASLQTAMHYLIPYVRGQKIHIMYVRPHHHLYNNIPSPSTWHKKNAREIFDKYRKHDGQIQTIYQQYYH